MQPVPPPPDGLPSSPAAGAGGRSPVPPGDPAVSATASETASRSPPDRPSKRGRQRAEHGRMGPAVQPGQRVTQRQEQKGPEDCLARPEGRPERLTDQHQARLQAHPREPPAEVHPPPSEAQSQSGRRSSARSSSNVGRARTTSNRAPRTQHFRHERAPVIGRGHYGAIGSGLAEGHKIARLQRRQQALVGEFVRRLANRPHHIRPAGIPLLPAEA